ncbi:tripartite tricarboxylate transporter TctB family protein [Jiangella asiatica]|uniref:tripartite tricarboxylate transporter TctB family protein n=1 Tax=Jiangella asiatica TaxID=2530372 RepID=UPI0013A5EA1F|nr:tripartite tricarboxylate transporter TctB family protein [Jiangella asiatica]
MDDQAETVPDDSAEPRNVIARRTADIAAGAGLAVIGTLVLSQAVRSRPGLSERLDPRTVPVFLSAALVVCGLGLIVAALRYKGAGGVLDWPTAKGWRRVGLATAAFVAYAQVLVGFGMAVATAVFVAGVEWALDRGSILRAVAWGLASGVAGSLVFVALLDVQLPAGPVDNLIASLVGG